MSPTILLAELVRHLRGQVFIHREYRTAHEREWETPVQETSREEDNRQRRVKWDAETEEMIACCLRCEPVTVKE